VHEPWTDAEPARAAEITLDLPNAEGEKMKEEEDERWMGKPSAFTCPDCNGTLWEVEDGNLLRFRCRVGHSYSGDGVRAGYNESVEAALWAAVRSLEESAALEKRLAQSALERGDRLTAARFKDAASSYEAQAEVIRGLVLSKESL
jgi:two-component system, chemotaxis family, protein-glutamate methylesterase/glutaminase